MTATVHTIRPMKTERLDTAAIRTATATTLHNLETFGVPSRSESRETVAARKIRAESERTRYLADGKMVEESYKNGRLGIMRALFERNDVATVKVILDLPSSGFEKNTWQYNQLSSTKCFADIWYLGGQDAFAVLDGETFKIAYKTASDAAKLIKLARADGKIEVDLTICPNLDDAPVVRDSVVAAIIVREALRRAKAAAKAKADAAKATADGKAQTAIAKLLADYGPAFAVQYAEACARLVKPLCSPTGAEHQAALDHNATLAAGSEYRSHKATV